MSDSHRSEAEFKVWHVLVAIPIWLIVITFALSLVL